MLLFSRSLFVLFPNASPTMKVFRSIDSNSVKGFPDDPKDAIKMVREAYGF